MNYRRFPAVIAALVCVCLLTGCQSGDKKGSDPKRADKTVASVTQTPETKKFEKFQEDGKYGIRRQDKVILDAVWDQIREYEVGERTYFEVCFAGYPERWGLFDDEGDMLSEPQWKYIFYEGSHYFVLIAAESTTNQIFDLETRDIVGSVPYNIDAIYDDYAVCKHYSTVVSDYNVLIYEIGRKQFIYENDHSCGEPEYYEGIGFIIQTKKYKNTAKKEHSTAYDYVGFNGVRFSGGHISVMPDEGLILVSVDREINRGGYVTLGYNSRVYTLEGESCGDFTINSQNEDKWYITDEGHKVKLVDALQPLKDPEYIFFDATARVCKHLDGVTGIRQYHDGMVAVHNAENKYGYVNDRGDFVYGFQFEDAGDFSNGTANVVLNYKKTVIDKKGDDKEDLYRKAASLRAEGDVLGAYDIFVTIRGYKDVDTLLQEPEFVDARKQSQYIPGCEVIFGDYYGPVSWMVLEQKDDCVLLLSKDILDYQPYHSYDYNKKASAVWASCSLRNWLNTTFLNAAFTAEQQKALAVTKHGSADDLVFLLSKNEAEEYREFLRKDPKYTDHAAAERKKSVSFVISDSYFWLLRNETGTDRLYTANGYVSSGTSQAGTRPAIWVKMSALP